VHLSDEASPLLAMLADPGAPGAESLRAGDLNSARSAYEAALGSDPTKLGALNDLAVAYAVAGHPQAARRLLDEVLSGGDTLAQQAALVNMGELHASEGYLSAASVCLETARGLDRGRPEPVYALALLADSRGDLAQGRSLMKEAMALDEGGGARSAFAYVYPEERVHLQGLVAEMLGDRVNAMARWRELSNGRFASLAAAAERHLAGE